MLGVEGVGVVFEIGFEVIDFVVGDVVMGFLGGVGLLVVVD